MRVLVSLLCALLLALSASGCALAQDEPPPLPTGLHGTSDEEDGPPLPQGLDDPAAETDDGPLPLPSGLDGNGNAPPDEPPLPADLGGPEPPPTGGQAASRFELPFDLHGFWDTRLGARIQHDIHQKHLSLGESRLQLQAEKGFPWVTLRVTGDLVADPVQNIYPVDLEKGYGCLDLREAWAAFTPVRFADVKAGRQILTWGTGDMIFINDLFPKDWNSFFIGRDVDYLKAPSDTVKVSLFTDVANLDFVYTPAFDADRYVDGTRITYWDNGLGRWTGANVHPERPNEWFHDDEFAARLHRRIGGIELAAYYYYGYWKSPGGMNTVSGRPTFPELSVYGASARANFLKGIANIEAGYYDSRKDNSGRNPFVNNSEARVLIGYEQEAARDLTVGAQWYMEHMMDYADYRRTLPAVARARDEDRHMFTLRLTQLLMKQDLRLSLFGFYSPTDGDSYLRPHANYKLDDHWSVEAGGNVFVGEHRHTFFNQFALNSNVFMGIRFSF